MENKSKKGEVPFQDENNIYPVKFYQAEDGQNTLEVQLKDETVWLNQLQTASLFQIERSVITKHINNISRLGSWTRNQYVQNLHILPPITKPTKSISTI